MNIKPLESSIELASIYKWRRRRRNFKTRRDSIWRLSSFSLIVRQSNLFQSPNGTIILLIYSTIDLD